MLTVVKKSLRGFLIEIRISSSLRLRCLLVLFVITLIIMRCFFLKHDDPPLGSFAGDSVFVTSIVTDDPIYADGKSKTVLRIKSLTRQSGGHPDKTFLSDEPMVEAGVLGQKIAYGDEVQVKIILQKPEVISDASGSNFDYPDYLATQGIFYTGQGQLISIVSHGNGNLLVSKLYELKGKFLENVSSLLPSPESYLAGAESVAGKRTLSKSLQLQFQKTGLMHRVTISGYNISIVGEAMMTCVSFLPLVLASFFGAVAVIFFSIIAGSGSSVTRACVMSLIGLFAKVSHRKNTSLTSLFVASSLMLVHNPRLIAYDPSFQMGLSATLGIIFLVSPIQEKINRTKIGRTLPTAIVSIISMTLAVQISTFPLVLKLSGMISITAIPANLLVTPFVPLSMFFIFASGSISFISHTFAMLPALVSWIFLAYELKVTQIFSSLPFSSFQLGSITWIIVAALYLLIVLITVWLHLPSRIDIPSSETSRTRTT